MIVPNEESARREDSLMWAIRFYENCEADYDEAIKAAQAFHAYVYGADQ